MCCRILGEHCVIQFAPRQHYLGSAFESSQQGVAQAHDTGFAFAIFGKWESFLSVLHRVGLAVR